MSTSLFRQVFQSRPTAPDKSSMFRYSGLPIRRMVSAAAIVVLAGAAAYPYVPRQYIGYANLVIRPVAQTGETTYTQTTRDTLDDNAIQTKMDILESLPLQQLVLRENDLIHDPEIVSNHTGLIQKLLSLLHPATADQSGEALLKLSKMLTVKREKHSYVIQVGYHSTDPIKSARLTNSLVNAFIADGIERKRQVYQTALDSQKQKIETLQSLYNQAEKEEHQFLVESGLINRSDIETMHHRLTALSDVMESAHAKAAEASTRSMLMTAALHKSKSSEDVDEAIITSPLLERLRERLIGLTTGTGQGTTSYGGNLTVINNLKKTINNEVLRIVFAARNDAVLATSVENSLKKEMSALNSKLTAFQASERKLDVLDQRLTAARTALNTALLSYNTQSNQQFQADVEILSQSVPPIRPVFPTLPIYGGGVLMLALLSAALMALPAMMAKDTASS